MNDYENRLESIQSQLRRSDLKYIHFNSISNFIYHLNDIKGENSKDEIRKYLDKYFDFFNDTLILDKSFSNEIYETCVKRIGDYFHVHLGFRLYSNLKYELFYSIIIDLTLLLTELLRRIYYLPICSAIILIRYTYLLRFKRDRKLYGYQF